MAQYSLKTILSTFTKPNGKQRMLFNKAPVGGLSANVVTLLLFTLPLISFLLIFKTSVFDMLGIATSIILFIISSSLIMIAIFLVHISVKKSVLKEIAPSWSEYFGDVSLNLLLSNTRTPYSDFFKYYEKVIDLDQSEEDLHKYLIDSFKEMQDDNRDLLEAMKKDNKLN